MRGWEGLPFAYLRLLLTSTMVTSLGRTYVFYITQITLIFHYYLNIYNLILIIINSEIILKKNLVFLNHTYKVFKCEIGISPSKTRKTVS